jgi:hypothetical protein
LLGGLGPRADLRAARTRIESLENDLKAAGRKKNRAAGVTEMLKIPVREPERRAAPAEKPQPPAAAATADEAAAPQPRPHPRFADQEQRKRFREELDTAASAWRLRSDLARNSFVSNVTEKPEEAADFDVLMAAMNMRLSNSISRWAETVTKSEDMDPETGIRMMNELSGVVVLTYDEMDRKMPQGWRDRAGKEFQLFDLIDPTVAMPLAGLEEASGDEPAAEAADRSDGASFEFTIGAPDGAPGSDAPAP